MSRGIGKVTVAQVRREMIRTDRKASRRRARIGALVVLATALLAGTLTARFLFALADIRTSGMSGTLISGDVVLCERMASPVRTGAVERGALVLARYSENGMHRQTVRRVIAMAGDEVVVETDGRVTVNGAALEEPYAVYRAENDWSGGEDTPGGALENPFATPEQLAEIAAAQSEAAESQVDDLEYPITVPEGRLFVLCDNREGALDSRSSRFGMVNEADVLGLPKLIIWPVYRAGLLTDD